MQVDYSLLNQNNLNFQDFESLQSSSFDTYPTVENKTKGFQKKKVAFDKNTNIILEGLPKQRKYLIRKTDGENNQWHQKGMYGTYILVYHLYQLLDEEQRYNFYRYVENTPSKDQIIITSSGKDKELWKQIGLTANKNFKKAKFINIKAFTNIQEGFIANSKSYKHLAQIIQKFEPVDHLYWERAANQSLQSSNKEAPIVFEMKSSEIDNNNSPEVEELKNPYVEKRKNNTTFNQVQMEKRRRNDHLPTIAIDKPIMPSVSLDHITSTYQGNKEKNRGPAEKNDVYWVISGNNFGSNANYSYLYMQPYVYMPPDGLKTPEMIPLAVNPNHIRSKAMSTKSPLLRKGNYHVVITYAHTHSPQSVLFSNALTYEAYLNQINTQEDIFFSEIFTDIFTDENNDSYFDSLFSSSTIDFQNNLTTTGGGTDQSTHQHIPHNHFSSRNVSSSSNTPSNTEMEDDYLNQLLDEEDENDGDDDDGDSNRDKKINTGTNFPFSLKLTQWHYACTNSDLQLLMNLQKTKSPGVDCVDSFNRTPLYLAAYYGHTAIVEQLFGKEIHISMKPNPNICDNEQVSPLHLACSYGNTALVDLLIRYGANIHCRSVHGISPLYCAFARGHEQLALKLVQTYQCHESPSQWVLRDPAFYLWLNTLPSIKNNEKQKNKKNKNKNKNKCGKNIKDKHGRDTLELGDFMSQVLSAKGPLLSDFDTTITNNTISDDTLTISSNSNTSLNNKLPFVFKREIVGDCLLSVLAQKNDSGFDTLPTHHEMENNIQQVFETHHGYPPNLGHYIANENIAMPHKKNNEDLSLLCSKVKSHFTFSSSEQSSRTFSLLTDPSLIHQQLFSESSQPTLHLAIFPPTSETSAKQSCVGLLIGSTYLLYCSSHSLCLSSDLRFSSSLRPLAVFPLSTSVFKLEDNRNKMCQAIVEWNMYTQLTQACGKKFVSHLLNSMGLSIPLNLKESTLFAFLENVQKGSQRATLHNNRTDPPIATFHNLDQLLQFKMEHITRYGYHYLLLDAFERAFHINLQLDRTNSQNKRNFFR